MKLLRNFDNAYEFYDIESSSFLNIISGVQISGWYKLTDKMVSGLLVENDSLYFLWNNINYQVNNSFTAIVKIAFSDSRKSLHILDNNIVVLEYIYEISEDLSSFSPFEYIDNEDFDWGLMVSQVINDKKRKENFINNLMKSKK